MDEAELRRLQDEGDRHRPIPRTWAPAAALGDVVDLREGFGFDLAHPFLCTVVRIDGETLWVHLPGAPRIPRMMYTLTGVVAEVARQIHADPSRHQPGCKLDEHCRCVIVLNP